MRKERRKQGFTFAEVLIVIAIMGVLSGLAFMGIVSYRRSLTKMEYDYYAKEVFVTAQNHLSMAKAQGYLGTTHVGFGEKESAISGLSDTGDGVYYLPVINDGDSFDDKLNENKGVLQLMLPFGSLDESVRAGGSYIVRYHKDSAQILDVFYWNEEGNYAYTYNDSSYDTLMTLRGDDHKETLEDYNGSVVGYYGGTDAKDLTRGEDLKAPDMVIHNKEMLSIEVTDTNSENENAKLKVVITGEQSNSKKEIPLSFASQSEPNIYFDNLTHKYTIILDDITKEPLHFTNLFTNEAGVSENDFIPGENLLIQAFAYNNAQLSNITYTAIQKTNSLFGNAKVEQSDDELELDPKKHTVSINNIRHLENLDPEVSGVAQTSEWKLSSAIQTTDLDWKEFQKQVNKIEKELLPSTSEDTELVGVTTLDGITTVQDSKGYFYPISPDYKLVYDGKDSKNRIHSINHVEINAENSEEYNAGIFSEVSDGSEISNLIITDIQSRGDIAGSIVGVLDGSTLTNVIAINMITEDKTVKEEAEKVTVIGYESAGGLVGTATDSIIDRCAASLVVSAEDGSAGGLVGIADDTEIDQSYSAGHTIKVKYSDKNYNVTATENAGGLVGSMSDTYIMYCYSTASVSSPHGIAGGLVGTGSGDIDNCYATGRVNGSEGHEGSIMGTVLDGDLYECEYFSIINERYNASEETHELLEDPNEEEVSAFDQDEESYYLSHTGVEDTISIPYDPTLAEYYQYTYNLPTVKELAEEDSDVVAGDLVQIHFGDWPAPEVWIYN